MTAEQLRNSILQEAISGRLVPQDPNDEPVTASAIIPEDDIPFEIPSTWAWVNFFSVYTLETNLVDPNLYLDYTHVAPDNIVKKQGKLLKCNTVKEDKVKSNNHLFHKGQIIYSKIRPLLRKAIIAPFDGLCSADMYPLSTTMDSQYALLYLLSDAFNNQVSSICSSRVKMPKINKDELSTILVPLPPLSEQKRIVAKLEELLPIVDQYGKAQTELDQLNAALPSRLRQSILRSAFDGSLTHSDVNLWEHKNLIEFCNVYQPATISTKELVENGEYDVYGANGKIGKYTRYNHEESEVLLTCRGATCGRVNISTPKSWINGNAMVVHPKTNDLSKEFLSYMLRSLDYSNVISGGAQPQITRKSLAPIIISYPSLAEQQRIVAKIEELFEQIDKIRK